MAIHCRTVQTRTRSRRLPEGTSSACPFREPGLVPGPSWTRATLGRDSLGACSSVFRHGGLPRGCAAEEEGINGGNGRPTSRSWACRSDAAAAPHWYGERG